MADGHSDLNGLPYGPYRRCSVAIAVVSLSLARQALVPWTNVDPEEQMYEYACRDDNYNMVDLLGARSQEANGETTDLD